jgi:hypothetical protein
MAKRVSEFLALWRPDRLSSLVAAVAESILRRFSSDYRVKKSKKQLSRVAAAASIRYTSSSDFDILQRRKQLGRLIDTEFKSTVGYGPFKGMRLVDYAWWGVDRAGMLLGFYEQEVVSALSNIPAGYDTFL